MKAWFSDDDALVTMIMDAMHANRRIMLMCVYARVKNGMNLPVNSQECDCFVSVFWISGFCGKCVA